MKVLIIGGGVVVVITARALRQKNNELEIVLVGPKDFFEDVVFAFRTPFCPKSANQAPISLRPWVEKYNIQHIQTTATKLTSTEAQLANGQDPIHFDVCLMGTGAGAAWKACGRGPAAPSTREERLQALAAEGDRLLNAQSTLIVGGGIIGCELAGELAYRHKQAFGGGTAAANDYKITLVHSHDHLCTEANKAAGDWIQKKLERKGVRVIVGDRVETTDAGDYILTCTGEVLEVDEVVFTTGLRPVNSFADISFLDSNGWFDVDDCFRVKQGSGRVFAFGDCCNKLYNSSLSIKLNKDMILKNIQKTLAALEQGKDLSGLILLINTVELSAFVLSLGMDDGVCNFGWFTVDWLFPWYKNHKMLAMTTKQLGVRV